MEPDVLEMMHADIDGRLSHAGREELKAILARDPALRDEHEQLRAIAVALANIPAVEPPRDLRASVMRAVSAGGATVRGGLRRGPWTPFGIALRYGYAFAAGLAVGILGLAWYTGSAGSFLSGHGLAGNMSPAGTLAEQTTPLDQFPISAAGLHGTVSLKPSAGGFDLEIDLQANEPIEVLLTHVPQELEILGWVRRGPGIRNMKTAPDGISWTMEGHPDLTIHLVPGISKGSQAAHIRLDFHGAEGAIPGGVLHLPAWNPPAGK